MNAIVDIATRLLPSVTVFGSIKDPVFLHLLDLQTMQYLGKRKPSNTGCCHIDLVMAVLHAE